MVAPAVPGAAQRSVCFRRIGCVSPAVQERVEQQHAIERNRKFLRGLHFRLRLLGDAALIYRYSLLEWGLLFTGRRITSRSHGRGLGIPRIFSRHFLPQGVNFLQQCAVFVLERVQPLQDLLQNARICCASASNAETVSKKNQQQPIRHAAGPPVSGVWPRGE